MSAEASGDGVEEEEDVGACECEANGVRWRSKSETVGSQHERVEGSVNSDLHLCTCFRSAFVLSILVVVNVNAERLLSRTPGGRALDPRVKIGMQAPFC